MLPRFLVNLMVGALWILGFNWLGWIQLSPQPHLSSDPGIGRLLDASLIALLIVILGEVAALAYKMFIVLTLGLGCLLLPLYWLLIGYVKLNLAAAILPGWFTYDHNLLVVLIMSWVLGASRWHLPGEMAGRREERG